MSLRTRLIIAFLCLSVIPLETEFGWSGFVTTLGLDGVIGEMQ